MGSWEQQCVGGGGYGLCWAMEEETCREEAVGSRQVLSGCFRRFLFPPSLPAALRLLLPEEEAFSPAVPPRFLRKSMNNTKSKKKTPPLEINLKSMKKPQSCLETICSGRKFQATAEKAGMGLIRSQPGMGERGSATEGGTSRFPHGTRDTRCPMHRGGDRDVACRGIEGLVLHVPPKPQPLSVLSRHFRAHRLSLFPPGAAG